MGQISAKHAAQTDHQLSFFKVWRLPLLKMATEVRGISPGLGNNFTNRPWKQISVSTNQVSQSVFAAAYVACYTFKCGQRMLDRTSNLWFWPARQVPKSFMQFVPRSVLTLLKQLFYPLPDSDLENLWTSNL